jgi:hypothetical protein
MNIGLLFLLLMTALPALQSNKKVPSPDVHLEISNPHDPSALLHWKISNNGKVSIFVYDFYLWGPAFRVSNVASITRIQTTPVSEEPSCPPNRFPPVLLLHVAPGRTIEGDFSDNQVKVSAEKPVSLTIAVGLDSYSVTPEAQRFANSNCKHSPYDAIVRWGTIIDSNPIMLRR